MDAKVGGFQLRIDAECRKGERFEQSEKKIAVSMKPIWGN